MSLLDKITDGVDDAHPLVLEGVESADFERLLWIVYPPCAISYSSALPLMHAPQGDRTV